MYLDPLNCTFNNAEMVTFLLCNVLHNKNKKIIKMIEGSIYRESVNQNHYIVIRKRDSCHQIKSFGYVLLGELALQMDNLKMETNKKLKLHQWLNVHKTFPLALSVK